MSLTAEKVSLIASIGAGVGAIANEKIDSPVSGQGYIPAVIGIIIAVIGYKYINIDGVGDFVEGFGVGYALDALI